jgi:glycosyltransferase involved in cell wall biosynthesis
MTYRILYIDSSGSVFGGGQVSLLELLGRVSKAKFRPFVVLSEKGKLSEKVQKLNIECEIIKMSTLKILNPFVLLGTLSQLFRFMKLHRISLIYANSSRAAIYAGLVAKFLKIPMLWHVRIPHSDRLLDRFLAFLSTKIIVVSQAVGKRFDWLPKEKKGLVYNGIDINKFSPTAKDVDFRAKFNLQSTHTVIGTVGRFSPEKGHTILISAIEKVARIVPKIKVLFIGDGNEKFRLSLREKIKKLELSSYFVFTGFCEDIQNILGIMDIFCLPSLSEGFNRGLLEAMACGLPVIATAVGGNIEVVKNKVNGLLVPPGNPEALASAIIALLKDRKEAQRMSCEGRRIVEENFSIETNVKKIEEIYLQILD